MNTAGKAAVLPRPGKPGAHSAHPQREGQPFTRAMPRGNPPLSRTAAFHLPVEQQRSVRIRIRAVASKSAGRFRQHPIAIRLPLPLTRANAYIAGLRKPILRPGLFGYDFFGTIRLNLNPPGADRHPALLHGDNHPALHRLAMQCRRQH